ncbi:MAG: response regulator transcription factor [Candidatus Cyclobacteriaceae bacterium M3_2C_046]
MKILIVEDNQELVSNIRSYLNKEGIVCEVAENLRKSYDKLAAFEYDVVVLDLMLPDGDGLELLSMIKQEHSDMGVLILSAKNSLEDKLKGLDLGADDFLPKPFHLSELNARLKAIYRRRKLKGSDQIQVDDIHINTNTQEVMVKEEMLDLTRKEYELLLFFISNKNRVLTKQTIAEHLWGDYMDLLDSFDFVYQHIKNLRKKMNSAGASEHIHTVYGSGYKFKI